MFRALLESQLVKSLDLVFYAVQIIFVFWFASKLITFAIDEYRKKTDTWYYLVNLIGFPSLAPVISDFMKARRKQDSLKNKRRKFENDGELISTAAILAKTFLFTNGVTRGVTPQSVRSTMESLSDSPSNLKSEEKCSHSTDHAESCTSAPVIIANKSPEEINQITEKLKGVLETMFNSQKSPETISNSQVPEKA